MVGARVGKDGSIRQLAGPKEVDGDYKTRNIFWAMFEINFGKTINRNTGNKKPLARTRINYSRVCIYHVNNDAISKFQGVTGETITIMILECMAFQVDCIKGNGNKACYYPFMRKKGEYQIPTYTFSLLQFWINRLQTLLSKYEERIRVQKLHQ